MMNIKELSKQQEQYVLDCRRWLHAHPELSCQEYETTKFIIAELEKMGIPVQTYEDCTGCTAIIEGGKPGKTVMLRADIDALPIQEPADKPNCSQNPGIMHACGHDGHTAMLLGAAKVLMDNRAELEGNVKLIFQMGEEIGRKAEEYVKRGALEGVDAIFGMHLWSKMNTGTANFVPGERMACSDRFTGLHQYILHYAGSGGQHSGGPGGNDRALQVDLISRGRYSKQHNSQQAKQHFLHRYVSFLS